jgi:5-methylcytosine-specific restriction endonuclease McrA
VCSLKRAFVLLYQGVAKAIDEEFRLFDFASWSALSAEVAESIGTSTRRIRVPRVLVLTTFDRLPRTRVRFSRHNIYLRDENTCQYCAQRLPRAELNLDHVVPRSKGGSTTWENVVCSCIPCNLRKANRTPDEADMPLMTEPRRPTRYELHHRQPEFDHRQYHHTWLDYLYWDSELES